MRVKKYLWGNPLLAAVEQLRRLTSQLIGNMVDDVASQSREAENRIKVLSKANATANKKTKAPMKANELAVLQDKLWLLGAFKGIKNRLGKDVTYELAVDGLIGNMTRQALANAKLMGHSFNNYDINEKSGLVTKKTPSKKITVTSVPKLEEVVDPYTGMPLNIPEGYGDSNLGNGYSMNHSLNGRSFFNNLYLFGYDNSKDTKKAEKFIEKVNLKLPRGLLIPKKYGLGYGAVVKVSKGVLGRDKAAKASNEFLDLDLTDPEQRKRGEELLKIMAEEEPKWGLRSGTLERKLKAIRGRYDLDLLHSGYPQKYNSYTVNSNFTPNGYEQAYVLSDPEMRLAYMDFASNYVKSNNPTRTTLDGKRIYSVKGGDPYALYGNFTIVTDADGSNIRYIDDWDFGVGKLSSKYAPGMKEIIISDKVL